MTKKWYLVRIFFGKGSIPLPTTPTLITKYLAVQITLKLNITTLAYYIPVHSHAGIERNNSQSNWPSSTKTHSRIDFGAGHFPLLCLTHNLLLPCIDITNKIILATPLQIREIRYLLG